jgi:branched-chain amino acid transport system permease protein
MALIRGRRGWSAAVTIAVLLIALPFLAPPLVLNLVNQMLIAVVAAVALTLLTGFAGLVSLGTAGLLAVGAYSVGILDRAYVAPIWLTVPVAAVCGGIFGLVFGLPSIRLRGVYLAIATLGLNFVVTYLGGEYETRQQLMTGIIVNSPKIGAWTLAGDRAWYPVLLAFAGLTMLFSLNLQRSRTGRAWRALRQHDIVAAALGIDVVRFKLLAFVASAAMTAVAGSLLAYFNNFVSIDGFSLDLSVQYLAMVIIGGTGSLAGAVVGAGFVLMLPYAIEFAAQFLPARYADSIFAMNYASFGLVMILFLLFEPGGLIAIWRRLSVTLTSLATKRAPVSPGDPNG